MHLRHIEPGSEDWREAMEDQTHTPERLTPEEATRLRLMLMAEQVTLGMPPVDLTLPRPHRHGRSLHRI